VSNQFVTLGNVNNWLMHLRLTTAVSIHNYYKHLRVLYLKLLLICWCAYFNSCILLVFRSFCAYTVEEINSRLLEESQIFKNNGHGVSCVNSVIYRRGQQNYILYNIMWDRGGSKLCNI